MEPPTPINGGISKIRGSRDAGEIEDLKKLIQSETGKLKNKKKQQNLNSSKASYSDDDDDESGGGGGGKKLKSKERERIDDDGNAKKSKAKGVWRKGVFIPQESTEKGQYRDRAKERRTGANPDYDGEIERMVEIDAEKSKYLGGDLKHTHLVKGLDYALLMKVKEETRRKEEEEEHEKVTKDADAMKQDVTMVPERILQTEYTGRPPTIKTYSGKVLYAALQAMANPAPKNFKKISYEFDLSDEAQTDVPTLLSRSIADDVMDADDDEGNRRMNYVMDESLMGRIAKQLEHNRLHGKTGRKKKRARENGSDNNNQKNKIKASETIDIFAGLAAHESKAQHTDGKGLTQQPTIPNSSSLKRKIFSGLYRVDENDEPDEGTISQPNREEIAKSIKQAAAAASSAGNKKGPSTDERDAFSSGNIVRKGHSLDQGAYELFPETVEMDEELSDQDEKTRSQLGEQMEKKAKRKRRRR